MLLLVEDIAIYFEAHTKDTKTLCDQHEEFCSLKHLVHTVGENRLLWGGFLIWGCALFHTRTCCDPCL